MEQIKLQNVKAYCYYSDASSFAQTEKAIHDAERDLGRIDILINNAGIVRDNLLMRMKEDEWDDVINNNLKSIFNTTKAALTMMLRQKSGSIINISSIVGVVGGIGQCNYAASKAGIIGFSKSVAKEIGSRNIRCNVIAPGFIETSMTDALPKEMTENWIQKTALRRAGQPQEIASAALFLASDLSSYITGQVLVCDGGMI